MVLGIKIKFFKMEKFILVDVLCQINVIKDIIKGKLLLENLLGNICI